MIFVYYMTGAPEGSTESGSGEAGNRTYDPWFTRHSAYQLHHGGFNPCQTIEHYASRTKQQHLNE